MVNETAINTIIANFGTLAGTILGVVLGYISARSQRKYDRNLAQQEHMLRKKEEVYLDLLKTFNGVIDNHEVATMTDYLAMNNISFRLYGSDEMMDLILTLKEELDCKEQYDANKMSKCFNSIINLAKKELGGSR